VAVGARADHLDNVGEQDERTHTSWLPRLTAPPSAGAVTTSPRLVALGEMPGLHTVKFPPGSVKRVLKALLNSRFDANASSPVSNASAHP